MLAVFQWIWKRQVVIITTANSSNAVACSCKLKVLAQTRVISHLRRAQIASPTLVDQSLFLEVSVGWFSLKIYESDRLCKCLHLRFSFFSCGHPFIWRGFPSNFLFQCLFLTYVPGFCQNYWCFTENATPTTWTLRNPFLLFCVHRSRRHECLGTEQCHCKLFIFTGHFTNTHRYLTTLLQ